MGNGANIPSHVVLVSDCEIDISFLNFITSKGANVVSVVHCASLFDSNSWIKTISSQLKHILRENYVTGIVVCLKSLELREAIYNILDKISLPSLIIMISDDINPDSLEDCSVIEIQKYKFNKLQLFIKRMIDIFGSILGIFLTLLVAIIIYPIVQKESKGPLLFKQNRVGQNGKIFRMYKFRSMYLDAEERKKELLDSNSLNTDLMFKMDNDPRIFPFGQKIRNWSIDELPQFINVLKGDMSLVGTRPPTVDEYTKYELHHFKRLLMKPGITGMWQVSGRSNIKDFEDVVNLDERYIKNWSVLLDIKLIIKTILVVLIRKGSK